MVVKFKISVRRDKEYPSYDHIKLHIFTYVSMGEALEYVLQHFPHIFLCKNGQLFEDMQLLYSLQYYLVWKFNTWELKILGVLMRNCVGY